MKVLGVWSRAVMAMCLLTGASPAFADQRWCDGKINDILLDWNGGLLVNPSFRGDWVQLCNIATPWGGISTKICDAWHADALSAMLGDRPVTIQYPDAPTCGSIGTYSASPVPSYFRMGK